MFRCKSKIPDFERGRAKSLGKRRIKEYVAVTKDDRNAAVSIPFKRGDVGFPTAS